ncbi:protein translocase subunit SecF [Patescibacteria group bacterium]|nr:protein translocase subunit SecF [Patescibacteria group bacterium]
MLVIKYRAFFFWLTSIILAAAIGAIAFFGLPLSIDFTGGTLMEVRYETERPPLEVLKEEVSAVPLGVIHLRESGETGVTLRARTMTPQEKETVIAIFADNGAREMTVLRANSIGPSMGAELATKALWAMLAVIVTIMLYIAWAFRRVSKPVPSWGFGIVVVAMLIIDIIVPVGFYAAWTHYTGAQVDVLFVVALLALLGYVVNDVIVIFDRIREHLRRNVEEEIDEEFEITIGKSIDETIGRSINTSLTVVLALLAIIFFGPEVTRDFAIVILVGVVIGTFSSIARSAPLLIPLAKLFKEKPNA